MSTVPRLGHKEAGIPIWALFTVGLSAGLLALAACGDAGEKGGQEFISKDAIQDFTLSNAIYVEMADVAAVLEADEVPRYLPRFVPYGPSGVPEGAEWSEWQDVWRDYYGEEYPIGPLDDISIFAQVLVIREGDGYPTQYEVFSGDMDFEELRKAFGEAGYAQDSYRDLEIWESSAGAIGVLENRSLIVEGPHENVKDFLRAINRGEGFIDDSNVIMRASNEIDSGMTLAAGSQCDESFFANGLNVSGCLATSFVIKGGDGNTTEISGTYLFRNEQTADAGRDRIEDALENNRWLDVTTDEMDVDGELVVFDITISN